MPVSSFRCTGIPSGSDLPSATTSSSRASRACASSPLPAGLSTRMRVDGNSGLSASASATVAVHSEVAPASSAARATSAAPWP